MARPPSTTMTKSRSTAPWWRCSRELFARNELENEDLVSVIFTATDDLHAKFPAAAARIFGLGDVPLLCARELDIVDATPRCIRVLIHVNTERRREEIHHVYQAGAVGLRDDLPS